MKAAIVEKPGVLTVRDIPMPVLGEYDVLCELLYGATCSGTDQHIVHGRMPWPIRYPVVLGHESIGRVVERGPKVRHFKQGDLITRVGVQADPDGAYDVAWGGFAEYGVARDHFAMFEDGQPRELWAGFRPNQVLPRNMDPAAATMVITWRETYSYLARMQKTGAVLHEDRGPFPFSNQAVLIAGSGGNGLSFVSHARNLGAKHIAMVGSPNREDAARAAGATAYCSYHTEDMAQVIGEQSDGFDYIIDAVGKRDQINRVLPLLNPRGTIGIYGIDEFYFASVNPRLAQGTFLYYNGGYDEAEAHERVVAFIEDGRLDARIWLNLDGAFPLDDINGAMASIRNRECVKALVRLTETAVS